METLFHQTHVKLIKLDLIGPEIIIKPFEATIINVNYSLKTEEASLKTEEIRTCKMELKLMRQIGFRFEIT